jgi:hypothetical protein
MEQSARAMIAIVILSLLCLALTSLVLRAVLFLSGKSDHKLLSTIASIAGKIGFLPIIAFEWVYYLVTAGLLILALLYHPH